MNPFNLQDKHILITGATSGIGRQASILCHKLGAKVTMIGRNKQRMDEVYDNLEGEKKHKIICDLNEIDILPSVISEAVNNFGKVDGFVHAAGIEMTLPLKLNKFSVFESQMKVNAFAGFEIVRLLSLKKNHSELSCSLVFIASVMGTLGESGQAGYCASKGAVIAAVRSFAVELAHKKIRVNAISPGMVKGTIMSNELLNTFSEKTLDDSKRSHLLGWATVEDVANSCVFLLSDASKNITGINLLVDGGYSAK